MSNAPSAWVKRKPPPTFPYSDQFPEPDPENPFLPLSELRARAKASSSTLVNPSIDSHDGYYSGSEGRRVFTSTPERAATDVEPPRRHGLVGYLSDVSKPLRPPKSWRRQGPRDTHYFSDDERANRFTQAFLYPRQQQTVATPEATPKERRASVQHAQDPQYHYRRRSQSVDILQHAETTAVSLRPSASQSAHDVLSFGDTRQSHGYAYVDFDDDHRRTSRESSSSRSHSAGSSHSPAPSTRLSETEAAHRHPTPPMTPDDSLSTASTSPLTDQFFAQNTSVSAQVALHDLLDDPPPVPVPKDNVATRTNRDTIVAYDTNRDTVVASPPLASQRGTVLFDAVVASPASSVSSLHPEIPDMETEPEQEPGVDAPAATHNADAELAAAYTPTFAAPPSPGREHAPLPPLPTRPSVAHVESDPETNTHTMKRKRSRVRKFSEFREEMKLKDKQNQVFRSTVKNSIRARSAARRSMSITAKAYPVSNTPSITTPEVVSVSPPSVPRVEGPTQRDHDMAGAFSDTEVASRRSNLAVPKPKKSLSQVNLGLKVLPNASLAPTIAPSANTSNASALGNLSIVNSKADGMGNHTMELLRAQTVPPVPRLDRSLVDARRAQTEMSHIGQHNILQLGQAASSGSESLEDLATYSVYTQFIVPLSPILPLASSTPAGPSRTEQVVDHRLPRVPSPVSTDEEDHVGPLTTILPTGRGMPLPAIPRRDSADKSHRSSVISQPRTESPVSRVKSPEPRIATQKVETAQAKSARHHQAPTPLPLSPPVRAKSPISAQLDRQHYESESETHELAPVASRTISPVPVPMKAKAVQDILQMSHSKDDERSSQRSRGSKSSRDREDTGYLPVAQLPTRPTASRQQTAQSQSSSRRSTVSKAHSSQVVTPVHAHPAQARTAADAPARPRAQSPTHAPPRVRSPEPVRAVAKMKTLHKDLDSPLPPPPVEVRPLPAEPAPRSASAPNPRTSSVGMRALAEPRRAATVPEVTSPMIFVTPPELQSPEPPPRQNTEPQGFATDIESTPAWTTQSHPDYLYEHGRSCSHHQAQDTSSHRNHVYPPDFSVSSIPTMAQLERAAALDVIAQNGLRVPFGDLFRDRKVVVIFIRHFCVEIETLKRAGVALVVIGNGSPAMIKSYRHIFRTPFALYTDPNLRVYNALGMTRRTTDPGPEHEKGDYVRHGTIGGIAMIVRNALRVGMPVWERGGEVAQLGGEFVLGPGMICTYAHRMKTTRDHAPITTVLTAAGVPRRPVNVQEMEDEQWPASRYASTSYSHKRTLTKADKRSDCTEYCEVGEVPYKSSYRGHRTNPRMDWEPTSPPADPRREDGDDMGADADADTEDDRNKVHRRQHAHTRTRQNNLKKGVRHYRIANPDQKRPAISHAPSSVYEKHEVWRSPTSAALDEFETRKHDYDPAYALTHEVLSYAFGNN
ncbi:hypothetical protein EIP86_008396 [Pleurotus ostreatoroseus]|nr:hypothetical protein EIP86_008396 [Pleurotus ostreatoroseus]